MQLEELRSQRAEGVSYAALGYFSLSIPFARVREVFQNRPDVFLPITTTETSHQVTFSLVEALGSIELTTINGSCMVKVAKPDRPLPLTADEAAIHGAALAQSATLAQISAGWRLTQDLARRASAQNVADLLRQDALLDVAFAALKAT